MDWTAELPGLFAALGIEAALDGRAVRGILDEPAITQPVGPRGLTGTEPEFTLASVDVPSGPTGLRLDVGDRSFRVVDARPDGTGVTVLILEASR